MRCAGDRRRAVPGTRRWPRCSRFETVSTEDNFFDDLGANSLLMAHFCASDPQAARLATTSMRDIYLHPTVARLARHLGAAGPVDRRRRRGRAGASRRPNLAYWTCGAAQLLFYAAYAYGGLWALNVGLNWVYGALGDPLQLYLRCVLLSAAGFFGMTGFAVAAKWVLIGRWKAERDPDLELRYYRFWVVKTLIRSAPVVLFRGSPLYTLYLRLLGAQARPERRHRMPRPCRSAPTSSRSATTPSCARNRWSSAFGRSPATSTSARSTSAATPSSATAASLDIDTAMGDGAQLGHSSSLQRGQRIPDGERWHGSPAVPTHGGLLPDRSRSAFPMSGACCSKPCSSSSSLPSSRRCRCCSTATGRASATITRRRSASWPSARRSRVLGTVIGSLDRGRGAVPRLLRRVLEARPRPTRSTASTIGCRPSCELASNSRLLNLLFGDSSAIVHYMRALGWNLNEVVQTGSNFGTNQQHENPLLCEIGSGTMVSDGLS